MPTRRAVTLALATVPLAGVAQAAPHTGAAVCPELARLHGEMLAISAEWNAIPGRSDEQCDCYADRLNALEARIIATPGKSLADLMVKLRVFRRYELPPLPHEELWEMADSEADTMEERLILSIARDIHRLAAVVEQAGA